MAQTPSKGTKMTISIEIKALQISSRTEQQRDLASVFTGTATVEVAGFNGGIEIEVKFKDAGG